MRHRSLAIGIVAAAILGTVALAFVYEDWGGGGDDRPLRLAVDVWVGFAPLHLAQDLGFFAAHGVRVEIVPMKGAEEIRSGLAAGALDGQSTSLDTLLMQNDRGIRSIAVLALDRSAGGDGIVASGDVRSVADLRGRTVGFQPATPSHFFLLFHLDRAGLRIADVRGREMDSGDAGAAFVAGRLDAAVTWEPWLSKAADRPGGRLLVSTGADEITIVDVLGFRPDVLRDRPDDIRGVVAAWDDAVNYWTAHPEEANRLMAGHYGLEPATFAAMIGGLEYLTLDGTRELTGSLEEPGPLLDLVDTINRVFLANGVTEAPHPLPEVFAYDFL